ncbi:hypothetical protein BJD78_gp45 [Arthrobacter phage KellEzio]|uniref:Uncharacterized protein n=1 Tax=Arthrobacter phage KellEzio TaxID=1796995 RepID=A0A140G6D0_9CAUD|nr:hypothetical protein BJD78_gp45 [Arthrobacter phage KellEzio]AMM44215.1 hypothetical protein KELLEZIO_45 [Arthrobacter phage KellEzio]
MEKTARQIQFEADYKEAEEAWGLHSGDSTPEVVWVQAEARTGSNYQVFIAPIPPLAQGRIGGKYLVSVLQPWKTCYPISVLEELHPDYVLERFRNPALDRFEVSGKDIAAMTLTINCAINRYVAWTTEEAQKQVTL